MRSATQISVYIMFKIYILKSSVKPTKTYVGKTSKPLEVRLKEHNDGLSRYTKTDRPWELIYYENFSCETCADKREIFLKSGFGFRLRKIILANYKELA